MNTAIDWSSTAIAWPQFDPKARDHAAASAQALEDYVSDWLDGDLYDDGEVYSAPVQALAHDDADVLGDLLRAYRSKDPAWFDHMAGRVARRLEKHIKAQAEEMAG